MLSLYEVTETFCTVGYGDFSPNYPYEYIWYMIMELTGVGVFTILIKRSQEFTLSQDTDDVSERKDNVDTWLMSLDRYSKKFTKIRQRDLRNIQDFFEGYFKKTPDIWLN